MSEKALRFNSGKIELTQGTTELLAAAAVVFMKNSKKYGGKYPDSNWRKGAPYSELLNCLKRHLAQFESGVDIDKDSGLPHLFLMVANLQMLLFNTLHHPENDDRDTRFPIDFSEFTKYLKAKEEDLDDMAKEWSIAEETVEETIARLNAHPVVSNLPAQTTNNLPHDWDQDEADLQMKEAYTRMGCIDLY